MTLERLNEHLALLAQVHRDAEMRRALLDKASPGASALTGMPHSTGVHDKVGDLAAELGDIDSHLAMLRQQVKQSEAEIMPFIQSIDDSQCRMIFRLRFIHGLSWGEVADFIGGRNTEQSVKMICYRFLESCDAM